MNRAEMSEAERSRRESIHTDDSVNGSHSGVQQLGARVGYCPAACRLDLTHFTVACATSSGVSPLLLVQTR